MAATMTASNAPRPYSRLETDAELLARIKAAGGCFRPEPVDMTAECYGLTRRIIWVTP